MSDRSSLSFLTEDRSARELVRGLNAVRPEIYWSDLLLSAVIGWTSFVFAVYLKPGSAEMIVALLMAVFALYRGLCFVHEISHHPKRTLPGFETVWNLLFGYPLLMPSSAYAGVHQDHHSLSTYGTSRDPEYMPFASSAFMTVVFAIQSFLLPLVFLLRYLVLSLAGLASQSLQKWLVIHFSSLTMNIAYRREATEQTMAKVRRQSIHILLLWAVVTGCVIAGFIPLRILPIWMVVSAVASFVNTLRTLGAHAYDSSGDPLDREGQLRDSIDTPGALWTELWAPVGLRYHALHHYFPGIPYHNLSKAWKVLQEAMPPEAAYRHCQSKGLVYSLAALIRRGANAMFAGVARSRI